jgi:hypothetical protein
MSILLIERDDCVPNLKVVSLVDYVDRLFEVEINGEARLPEDEREDSIEWNRKTPMEHLMEDCISNDIKLLMEGQTFRRENDGEDFVLRGDRRHRKQRIVASKIDS